MRSKRISYERIIEFLAHLDQHRPVPRRALLFDAIRKLASSFTEEAETRLKDLLLEILPPLSWARPPGAVEDVEFFLLCKGREGCTACVDACESASGGRVIKFIEESDSLWQFTPYLDPNLDPCMLCEGFPCATACPTGALSQPPSAIAVSFGRAVVNIENCSASVAEPCRACVDACPSGISALTVARNGFIAVSAYLCVGCGLCVKACPQDPKGIYVIFRGSQK